MTFAFSEDAGERTAKLQHQFLVHLLSTTAATGPVGITLASPATGAPVVQVVDVDLPTLWSSVAKPSHEDYDDDDDIHKSDDVSPR